MAGVMTPEERFASNLRRYRKAAKLTQEQLGEDRAAPDRDLPARARCAQPAARDDRASGARPGRGRGAAGCRHPL